MFRSISVLLLLAFSALIQAQDILLFNEDFESGGVGFALNTGGVGSNSGNNQWIVNNQYSGAPTYPNTTQQNNTNGGTISFAPTSNYLHIHDAPSGILNANYDPASASDRFAEMAGGICTYGMEDVHFSFFYLCQGSPSAYGSIYYSLDGGPWTQFGQAQYSGMNVWQYVDITDPSFQDVGSLRFGFRWQDTSASPPYAMSYGIDDVTIVATYSETNPVTINVTSVTNPVCQGGFISISYELSDTLCDGNYQIEISNSQGNFPSPYGSWVMPINYPTTSGTVTIQIPNNIPVGDCFKIRISRMSPPPVITGIASFCFEIIECPNIINTMQPVVTLDSNAVCVGSAIDVPFTSTGVYANNNNYIAQLSSPDGTFPANPLVVGSSPDNNTYDPMLGQLPGSVSGLVPLTEPGCNYYIRVISSNPQAIGSPWGPFCIQQCDITTNNMQDLNFCVYDCETDPDGENETIDIEVNTYNNNADYPPGNIFNTQLLSSLSFGQIGSDGILGSTPGTGNTTLNVHVPCADSLPIYGIPLGMNYMRVVASESTDQENSLGSLIRVTIGAYRNEPQIITSYEYPLGIPSNVFCIGETVQLLFQPYNYFDNSTYMWQCNGINGGQPFESPSGANSNSLYVIVGGAGTLTFSIQETNYGCVGPWSPVHTITVLGSPNINISGPTSMCDNDTALFQVPFYPNTYYSWSNNADLNEIAYQDTANNILNIAFEETGTYTLNVSVLNACGSDSDTHTVTVLQSPDADAGPDELICIGGSASLSAETDIGYAYAWTNGNSNVGNTQNVTVSPNTSTEYVVTITGPGQCQATDTVLVEVQLPDDPTVYQDVMCPGGMNELTLEADTLGTYLWYNGANTSSIVVNDTGLYSLSITIPGLLCPYLVDFDISAINPAPAIQLTDSICPGGLNDLLLESPDTGDYLWSTGETTADITVNNIGDYSLEIFHSGEICQDVYEFEIVPYYPAPPMQLIDSICPGGGNEINLQPPVLGDSYLWSTGSTAPIIGINNPGDYDLQVFEDGESCQRLYEWNILPMTPDAPIQYLDSVCPGGRYPIRLIADELGDYEWSTGESTSFINVNDTGIFVLNIYAPGERCPRTLEWTIIPDSCISRPDLFLYVPNSITTNNDGLNEFFLPIFSNPDLVIHYELKIYDRWGEQVFLTDDLTKPWIGNFKDGEYYVKDEVFIYMIEYRQEFTVDNIQVKGHVVVLR